MAFVVQLVQRLRDQDPNITPALTWLEGRLAAQGTTAEAVVRDEHQRQGSSNVTVRNIITSMRLISELEWSDFFESVSLVDDALREGSDFSQMDFATRNLYRSSIEDLSRRSKLTELEIVRAAIGAASRAPDITSRQGDPGYHLIASGRPAFETAVGYRAPLWRLPGRWIMRHGAGPYICTILLATALIIAMPLLGLDRQDPGGWPIALLVLFGFLPALDAAIAVVNRAVTLGFGATTLPGLALRDGVPAELRTLVAIPVL
jgi:cyclic beta-1,2-glucan synthetase